jgi:large conductance mechanosensitive channel
MGMLKEFKEFAMRGNVVDLAVGVIIGGAFGKIITSMVNDILMPPIGKAMGGVNFADLFFNLDPGKKLPSGEPITSLAQAKSAGAAVIAYGQFINTILDFMIVAACIFAVVKGMNTLKRRLERAPAGAPATKECPECLSAIPLKAKRCAHCAQPVP